MSPDGKSLAFIAQGAIKTIDVISMESHQLMPPPDNGAGAGEESASRPMMDASSSIQGPFQTAAISSDGRGIAGVKEVSGGEGVEGGEDMGLGNEAAFAIPPGSDKSVVLNSGREVSVAWEPNGSRVACAFTEFPVKQPDGKTELTSGVILWSFENPQRPTAHPIFIARGYSIEPRNVAWSPDGTKIAFEAWRAKGEDDRELKGIVVMPVREDVGVRVDNAQAADAVQYMVPATPDAKPQRPLWSPDGSRLLYEVMRKDGGRDLWDINASDGTDPINLTQGQKDGADNYEAAWSPVHRK